MKATTALLADHKMVRKILKEFRLDNPRFPEILKTLHRVLLGHAWFEDEVFLPAFRAEPLLQKRFTDEISQEHNDLHFLMTTLRGTNLKNKKELEAIALQFRTVLDTHFSKEEDALFPMAERILDEEGLNKLGDEMRRRQAENKGMIKPI
jgi:hemerythrin-like domain-containing protein